MQRRINGRAFQAETALNDLYERHGLADQVVQFIQPNPYYAFCLEKEPDGFSVATRSLHPVRQAIRQLCSIEEPVLGISRDRHHEYFLNAQGGTCYIFRMWKNAEGYAYVWSNGRVGPLAVVSSNSFRGVMNTALGLAAAQGTHQVSVMIPGSNDQAVAVALDHKLRIAIPLLLMSSQRFGNWDNYLFYSPALM